MNRPLPAHEHQEAPRPMTKEEEKDFRQGLVEMVPVLRAFARSLFGALQTGEGDQGGRALLSGAALVAADAAELADIDRPGDLPVS